MKNLEAYVQLVDEIADGLDSIQQQDGESDHKQLSNVAEKYLSAIQLYNLVLYSFIEEGLDLVFDLTEFYHTLSDAEHPASEMFQRATACSPSADGPSRNHCAASNSVDPRPRPPSLEPQYSHPGAPAPAARQRHHRSSPAPRLRSFEPSYRGPEAHR